MYKDDTILVVGQAKPSKEDAIYSLHGEFYVSFVVERATGKILDLECNTILSGDSAILLCRCCLERV
ncbi:MAG: DUF3870 domain-containing protein [Clostridium fessum]